MKETAKKYALSNAPTIEAVTGQLLRLATEQQALDWLATLEKHFIISRHQIDEKTKQKSLILWIKNYDLTDEEKEKGYVGNFVAIAYRQKNAKWTLYPTKIYVDLAQHPQRKYTNTAKHPNWGHPVLRNIKKKHIYKTEDAARADLMRLHEEFPTASIPAKKRFYLMIFSREENKNKPISKYVFEVKLQREGGFYIDYKINNFKSIDTPAQKKEKVSRKKEKADLLDKLGGKTGEDKGYFSSMVQSRRKKIK